MSEGFESDEIDGVVIHSCTSNELLIDACRTGDLEQVRAILRTWGTRAIPEAALHEAVAWSRVEIVRWLLRMGASVTAKGAVHTPGGSGLHDAETHSLNAVELSKIMYTAGLRPRRAMAIIRLIEEHLSGGISPATDHTADNDSSRRVPKPPHRYPAGPSQRGEKFFAKSPVQPAAIRRRDDEDARRGKRLRTTSTAPNLESGRRSPLLSVSREASLVGHSAQSLLSLSTRAQVTEGRRGGDADALAEAQEGEDNDEVEGGDSELSAGQCTQASSQEIAELRVSVGELRQMLSDQGRMLAEQHALLRAIYTAGTAAAIAFSKTRGGLHPPPRGEGSTVE